MGENANVKWDWHNDEVGKGYQARGVIRQPSLLQSHHKTLDLSLVSDSISRKRTASDPEASAKSSNEDKKRKKDRKMEKKHKKKKSSSHEHLDRNPGNRNTFNPLLQLLASHLSNTTLSFSPTNS